MSTPPRVFQVVSGCFDPATDDPEDHVFWVAAPSEHVLHLTIAYTGASSHTEVINGRPELIDYRLPDDTSALLARLEELHKDVPGLYRPRPC